MPGIQDFTYLNWGKESTRGTAVAPTRKLYATGSGVLDIEDSVTFHEEENRGTRADVVRATARAEDVNLKAETAAGVGWDDLLLPMLSLKGGLSPTGAGADKTWTITPSLSAANNPDSVSVDVGDDIQNWRCQYVMCRSFKIKAALGELTQMSLDAFAQRAVKVAKATPADNVSPKIPGDLWTVKYAATLAGLPGASIVANFLVDWELEIRTGVFAEHYMDGNLYFGQHVETSLGGTLTMTVESTAQAITQFVDKYRAQTLDFVRLKATGAVLGGSNYSAQVDLGVLYDKPSIIDSDRDGINLYKITARVAADSPTTPAQNMSFVLVNALTAIP